MNKLINNYSFELSEPPCSVGSGRYGLKITLNDDIHEVLPYLNAVMEETQFDKESDVLIGTEGKRKYAFRQGEIRVSGIDEVSEAPQVAKQAIDMVNRVWSERNCIKPNYSERKLPTVIEILQLLPRTNCKKCGLPTCLVFASDLRAGKASIEHCVPLVESENPDKLQKIKSLFFTAYSSN